jgi:2-(1,2-epoxy-1,2-dihydrophenyl)acetyl-CoA isomerase
MLPIGPANGFEISLHEPGIALFTFNRPEQLNGMSRAMKRDLVEAVTQAQMDNAVRVVVFTGQGRGFCAGDTLGGGYSAPQGESSLVPEVGHGHDTGIGTYAALRTISQAVNVAIRNLDKVSIAAINGVAIQTGLSLALACDFRIASTQARLGSATLRFGLLPDEGGQYLVVQLIGVGKAMDFFLRKRIVSAEEALELGLVHEVVEPEQLMERAMALAKEMAEGPQVSMRLLKRSIYAAATQSMEQAMDDIATKTAISDHHPDTREGVGAWRDKRTPHFNEWLEKKPEA